jgi:hypothetical protein
MADLTPTERSRLRQLAGCIIPASTEFGVPGADDETIFADVLATLMVQRIPLDAYVGDHGSEADIDTVLQAIGTRHPLEFGTLIAVVTQCYYRDDRVMRSLGMEARPPFPVGYKVKEGDWSLLDPVRARPKLWREAP